MIPNMFEIVLAKICSEKNLIEMALDYDCRSFELVIREYKI
jgi:hypothetical protein